MKIILLKEVKNLGKRGDIKEVADGYARNFLLPNGLALMATEAAARSIKESKDIKNKKQEKILKSLSEQKGELENRGIIIKAKANEAGHLFAGVGADLIARELEAQRNVKVKPENIKIEKKIKQVGEFVVGIRVGAEEAGLKVRVEGLR